MKKFVLALLAVVLVLGLCTVAYADHTCTSTKTVVTYVTATAEYADASAIACGTKYYEKVACAECDYVASTSEWLTKGHSLINQIDRPECGATGSTYDYCTSCKQKFNEEYTAVKQHTVTAYVAATCTEDAYFYCPDCKQTVVEKDSKLGHHKVLPAQNEKEATCTEDGYELWICDRAGCDWTELKNFPKFNHKDAAGKDLHKVVTYVYEVETCTEWGKYLVKCEKCTDTIVKDVEPLGHAWTAWHIDEEATCEMKGFKSRLCTRPGCQDLRNGKPVEEVEELPALGHDIVYTVTKKATCAAEGEEFGTCARCEKTFTRPIAMVDHTWTEYTVIGQCKVRTCKVCYAIEKEAAAVTPDTPADPDAPAVDEDDNNSEGTGSTTGSGSDASIPATGDNTSNVPYIMMVAAVAGLVVLVASKRKVNC